MDTLQTENEMLQEQNKTIEHTPSNRTDPAAAELRQKLEYYEGEVRRVEAATAKQKHMHDVETKRFREQIEVLESEKSDLIEKLKSPPESEQKMTAEDATAQKNLEEENKRLKIELAAQNQPKSSQSMLTHIDP